MRPPRRLPQPNSVPIVLPQVIVTIDEGGGAQLTVDGIERHGEPVERDQLGSVLSDIAEAAGAPVRVEVRESDGTRYADILQPQCRQAAPHQEQHARSSAGAPVLLARGFTPGERVLITVLASAIYAEADGAVRLLTAPKTPRGLKELILIGTVSRRTVRGRRVPAARSGWWQR